MQVLRLLDARTGLFPFASLDYGVGGRLATRHLLDLGARRVAFVGGLEDRPVTTERMAGYLAVMAEADLEPTALFGRPSRAFGRDVALGLARARPELEAAVCFSDLVALGMLAGFAEAGVRVGADFRLVGFDDIEECALSWPQLSSVRCDVASFGRRSAQAMLAWLESGEQPPESQLAPVELIARHSSLGV
jgi:LacI family transcriptional regulator